MIRAAYSHVRAHVLDNPTLLPVLLVLAADLLLEARP